MDRRLHCACCSSESTTTKTGLVQNTLSFYSVSPSAPITVQPVVNCNSLDFHTSQKTKTDLKELSSGNVLVGDLYRSLKNEVEPYSDVLELVADLTLQATNSVVFLHAKDYEALLNSKFAENITLASDFMSAMTGYVGKIANTALFTDMFEYPKDTFLTTEGFYYVYAKDEHGTPE